MIPLGYHIWSVITAFQISNKEMEDAIKIVKYLKESSFLIKDVSKTINTKPEEQKGGVFGMLVVTLGDSFLGKYVSR